MGLNKQGISSLALVYKRKLNHLENSPMPIVPIESAIALSAIS
jgi:hypothetical protein